MHSDTYTIKGEIVTPSLKYGTGIKIPLTILNLQNSDLISVFALVTKTID
jgi:hypothetical protein